MPVQIVRREPPQLVDPDNSALSFEDVLDMNRNHTPWGWLQSWFKPWVTVAVPLEYRELYPSCMTTLDGRPLWDYKLVGETVYRLRAQPDIGFPGS